MAVPPPIILCQRSFRLVYMHALYLLCFFSMIADGCSGKPSEIEKLLLESLQACRASKSIHYSVLYKARGAGSPDTTSLHVDVFLARGSGSLFNLTVISDRQTFYLNNDTLLIFNIRGSALGVVPKTQDPVSTYYSYSCAQASTDIFTKFDIVGVHGGFTRDHVNNTLINIREDTCRSSLTSDGSRYRVIMDYFNSTSQLVISRADKLPLLYSATVSTPNGLQYDEFTFTYYPNEKPPSYEAIFIHNTITRFELPVIPYTDTTSCIIQ